MQPLSKKEVEIIAQLEFDRKYFFTREDIRHFFKDNQQISDFIYGLRKKERIIKINRRKYYLIPIKAKSGTWSEDSFILTDEICDGKNYVIGGWFAANYWRLTDQIPVQVDVYTTRRQGKMKMMNTRLIFHRTSRRKIEKAVVQEISGHSFMIMSKEDTNQWVNSRESL